MSKEMKIKYTWLCVDADLPRELIIRPDKLITYAAEYIELKLDDAKDRVFNKKRLGEEHSKMVIFNEQVKFWEGQLKAIEKIGREMENKNE